MQYEISNEVAKVAERVIKQFHPDLSSKNIQYMLLDKKDKTTNQSVMKKNSRGHVIPAEIEIHRGAAALLISREVRTDENGPTPVVSIKVYNMPWLILDAKEREAMLDEQLCRLIYNDETGAPSKLDYDAKLMAANVARFGAYNESIERILKAAKELPLIEIAEDNGKAKKDITSLKADVAKKRGRAASAGT
jgi:hypothetical protein